MRVDPPRLTLNRPQEVMETIAVRKQVAALDDRCLHPADKREETTASNLRQAKRALLDTSADPPVAIGF